MRNRAAVSLLIAGAVLFSGRLFAQDSPEEPASQVNMVNSGFQVFGGLGVPLGDFADSDKGAAKTGFALGAQYTLSLGDAGEFFKNTGILISGTFASNSTDVGLLSGLGLDVEGGSYNNIFALGGLKTTIPTSEALSIDLAVGLGAVFSSSPEIDASGSGITAKISSASATAFAWSVAGDLVIAEHFTFGLRYYDAKPKYKIDASISGPGIPVPFTETLEAEQPTAILVVCVGYLF